MEPKLFMMIGLPGSGKSFASKRLAKIYKANIHSSDELRNEFTGDSENQNVNREVFAELHKRVKRDLLAGECVIYDATNINYKRRKAFLAELKNIKCQKNAILMVTPYNTCLKQNNNREHKIPDEVITRMYKNFNIPYWYEGWDNIYLCYSQRSTRCISGFLKKYKHFEQNNIHHSETLGQHCKRVAKSAHLKSDKLLKVAGSLHDCGKQITKSFKNSRGETTLEAHYYQHHCVGAYESLFYRTRVSHLDVAILIQWHMQPYCWEKDDLNGERQRLKYYNLWGKDLYDKIMLLHKADVSAH